MYRSIVNSFRRVNSFEHVAVAVIGLIAAFLTRSVILANELRVPDLIAGLIVKQGYNKISDPLFSHTYLFFTFLSYLFLIALKTEGEYQGSKTRSNKSAHKITNRLRILGVSLGPSCSISILLAVAIQTYQVPLLSQSPRVFAVITFLLLLPFSFQIISRWLNKIHFYSKSSLETIALLIFTPSLIAFIRLFSEEALDALSPSFTLSCFAWLLYVSTGFSHIANDLPQRENLNFYFRTIGVPAIASLLPYALILCLSRIGILTLSHGVSTTILCGLSLASLLIACFIVVKILESGNYNKGTLSLSKLAIAIQAPILLLYFHLLPFTLKSDIGTEIISSTPRGLMIVCVFFVTLGLTDLVRRFRKLNQGKHASLQVLSPFTVAAILLLIRFNPSSVALTPPDDYHFGENLLPWWQWSQFGDLPYIDFFPAHGFINLLPGWLGQFYPSTGILNFILGNQLLGAFILIGLSISLSSLTSPLYAFTILAFLPFIRPSIGWNLITISILCHPKIFAQPVVWLGLLSVLGTLGALLEVGPGAALFIAILPIALFIAYRGIQHTPIRMLLFFATLIVLCALTFATPLSSIVFGMVKYLRDNSAVNLYTYGTQWNRVSFGFEMLRTGWLFFLPLMLFIGISQLDETGYVNAKRKLSPLCIVLTFLCFTILMTSYTFGRIDAAMFTRMGLMAVYFFAFIVPICLFFWSKSPFQALSLLIIILGATPLNYPPQKVMYTIPLFAYSPAQILPSQNHSIEALAYTINDPEHIQRAIDLKNDIDSILSPNDRYLDLTNRNALHFYTARPPASPISAYYNISSTSQQKRVAHHFENKPPPISIVSADNQTHDDLRPLERAPIVVGNLLKAGHRLAISDRFAFLISPGKWDAMPSPQRKSYKTDLAPKDYDGLLSPDDIASLPQVWGNSIKEVAKLLKQTSSDPTHNCNYVSLENQCEVALPIADSEKLDLLSFSVQTPPNQTLRMGVALKWRDGTGTQYSQVLKFNARNGVLLVPLDYLASHHIVKNVEAVEIRLLSDSPTSAVEIGDIFLWARSN